MKQTLEYGGKLPLVETVKHKADQKREIAKFQKQIYDNKRGLNYTTNGNEFSRFKANVKYWEAKLEVAKEDSVYLNEIIVDDQNDIIADFAEDAKDPSVKICDKCHGYGEITQYHFHESPTVTPCTCDNGVVNVCVICKGAGQNYVYQDGEALDVVDCVCTSDKWDHSNQEAELD